MHTPEIILVLLQALGSAVSAGTSVIVAETFVVLLCW